MEMIVRVIVYIYRTRVIARVWEIGVFNALFQRDERFFYGNPISRQNSRSMFACNNNNNNHYSPIKYYSPIFNPSSKTFLTACIEKRAEKDRNEIRGQIARWGYFRWNGRMRGFSQQWPAKFIMVESDSNGSEIWGKKNMRSRSRFLSFLDIIEIVSDAYKYFPIS